MDKRQQRLKQLEHIKWQAENWNRSTQNLGEYIAELAAILIEIEREKEDKNV